MIEYIRGELSELTPAMAVVDAGGVGYGMGISLNTYSAIQGKKQVKLYVFESIREDAYQLFGFASKTERALFIQLISVSGIGANTTRMILSEMTPAELCNVISTGNVKLLKTIKGIGQKSAERIIVELRDKIVSLGIAQEIPANADMPTVSNKVIDEAMGALTMLGFAPAASKKVVMAILKEQPDAPVETVVKLSLKQIK